jgi:hypothetical protein
VTVTVTVGHGGTVTDNLFGYLSYICKAESGAEPASMRPGDFKLSLSPPRSGSVFAQRKRLSSSSAYLLNARDNRTKVCLTQETQ